jgi:hypothetical protein
LTLVNPLKHEVPLNTASNFSYYISEIALLLHYKEELPDLFREITALFSKNHRNLMNTHIGKNAKFFNVKAGAT